MRSAQPSFICTSKTGHPRLPLPYRYCARHTFPDDLSAAPATLFAADRGPSVLGRRLRRTGLALLLRRDCRPAIILDRLRRLRLTRLDHIPLLLRPAGGASTAAPGNEVEV